MGCFLIHDLGTSGCKAALFSETGRLIADSLAEYPTYYPAPGFVEQRADDWWDAVCRATHTLMEKSGIAPGDILGISFSGQMMGCLPVDAGGGALHPAVIWADTRAQAQEERMIRRLGMERVYRITGHRASASYTACKWMWLRENAPELAGKTHKLLHTKDFIVHRMTARFVTDPSDASGTNLLDIEKRAWSEEITDALEIPRELLPDIVPSASIVGPLLEEPARILGLLPGTPVIMGGGDGSCACAGAGALTSGDAYMALGTSSWISTVCTAPVFDPEMRTFNWVHLDPALTTPCGTMQASGASFAWFLEEQGMDADKLENEIAQTGPGAGGVLFLPYLLGERSPRWNHAARGAFIGLSRSTSRGEMGRAVLEGVAMNLRIILDAVTGAEKPETLMTIGGGASGTAFSQVLADILEIPLAIPADPRNATALGAAICAAVALKVLPDFAAGKSWNRTCEIIAPKAHPIYDGLREAFEAAYVGLRETDRLLHELRKAGG